jgi:chromosome segregation ATPase
MAMAELAERRSEAQARIDQLEAEQRAAGEARETARAALIEAERRGGPAAERAKLEKALAAAEVRAAERWPERIAGARAALRDVHEQLQHFSAEHLDELVAEKERDGEVAAARVTEHAEALLAAYHERERVAGEIATLVSTVARLHPGDLAFSRAEAAARACQDLVESGGEAPPQLQRDPRQPRHGALAEAEAEVA